MLMELTAYQLLFNSIQYLISDTCSKYIGTLMTRSCIGTFPSVTYALLSIIYFSTVWRIPMNL